MRPAVPARGAAGLIASAPPRFGGLGLRPLARHAALAMLAAYVSTRPLLLSLFSERGLFAALKPDDELLRVSGAALASMPPS